MARRRRLDPPTDAVVAPVRAAAAADDGPRPAYDPMGAPPIARVAADSVAAQRDEIGALQARADGYAAAAARLADAEASGALVIDVDIALIDLDYLSRDRLPRSVEGEEQAALRASIQAHGQRTPIELVRLGPDHPQPYGLISGYRRIATLKRLFAETGDARFSRAKALARPQAGLGAAFIAMVEENEVREGLSYFERGRVCVRAAEQGAFPSVDSAIDALFASASPAKRSKIRSFVLVAEELGDILGWPEAIGERLGLRIAQALRRGQGADLRRLLGQRATAHGDAATEQAALTRYLEGQRDGRGGASHAAPEPASAVRREAFPGGAVLVRRLRRNGATFQLTGAALDQASLDHAWHALAAIAEESSRR